MSPQLRGIGFDFRRSNELLTRRSEGRLRLFTFDAPRTRPNSFAVRIALPPVPFPLQKGVRLIGVSLSSLCAESSEVDPQVALAL